VATPGDLAPELLARAGQGAVALLFGPEDNGLTNAELDRCHAILSIPTNPAYASLNLAQAVLIAAYEIRQAGEQRPPRPAGSPAPADAGQLEELFGALERALWGIGFFKARQQSAGIMRTLRGLIHRAEPDAREARLLKAIALETISFLRRKGIEAGGAEAAEHGSGRAAEAAEDSSTSTQETV